MDAIPEFIPCIEPYVATDPVSITFGPSQSDPIPFRTQAVECLTHIPITEPDYTTNRMSTYPYTMTGTGGGTGYAICLNRGTSGPSGGLYGRLNESDVHTNAIRAQAVRFILGNIPANPN